MIETSENIVALTGAIIKVQGGISGVHKNAKNPHFKSSYATLENVIDTARPALQEAGIAFVQAPGMVVDGSVEVTTMLIHDSGEWMRSTLHVPLGKRDPQGVGSAITYGCRYSLMAMLGLPPTDDDGEAAMERDEPKRTVGINPKTGMATANALKKDKGPDNWDAFQAELLDGIHRTYADEAGLRMVRHSGTRQVAEPLARTCQGRNQQAPRTTRQQHAG
jgi:hypothetical protein